MFYVRNTSYVLDEQLKKARTLNFKIQQKWWKAWDAFTVSLQLAIQNHNQVFNERKWHFLPNFYQTYFKTITTLVHDLAMKNWDDYLKIVHHQTVQVFKFSTTSLSNMRHFVLFIDFKNDGLQLNAVHNDVSGR